MKKIVFTLSLVALLCSTLFSQDKKIGLTLQVSNPIRDTKVGWFDVDSESLDGYNIKENSFALGALGTYKVSTTNYRIRVNFTKIGIEEYQNDVADGTRYKQSVIGDQNKFSISPGVSWNMNKDKLDIYVGIEIPINLHGKFTLDYESIQTDSISGDLVSDTYMQFEIENGYSVGVGGIFGFNYFLSPKFSLGAEFSPSILYSNLGGEVKAKNSTTTPPPAQNHVGVSEDKFDGFTHYENRFSFGVSFWLN